MHLPAVPSPTRAARRSLAIGCAALVALAASLGYTVRVSGSSGAASHAVSDARRIAHADCLWYSARNNGFYPVQRDVVRSGVEAAERATWQAFLDTAGARDCGAIPAGGVAPVLAFLAASAEEADRHFLGAAP